MTDNPANRPGLPRGRALTPAGISCAVLSVILGLAMFFFDARGAQGAVEPPLPAAERLFLVALIGGTGKEASYPPADIARVFFNLHQEGSGANTGIRIVVERVPEPESQARAEELFGDLSRKGVLAAICSARGAGAFFSHRASRNVPFPVIFLYSEDNPRDTESDEGTFPFIFSLDFDASFRPAAIALWGKEQPGKKWAIFTDHLDSASTASGSAAAGSLLGEGIASSSLASIGSEDQRLYFSLRKSLDEGSSHILSGLTPRGTLKLSSLLRSTGETGAVLVYGREPSDELRGCQNIVAFTQNYHAPLTIPPKGSIFSRFLQDDAARPSALKTIMACQWLQKAASSLPPQLLERDALKEAMEGVDGLEAFGFIITLAGKEHRPAGKEIFVLRSAGGKWSEIRRIQLHRSPEGVYFIDRKTGGTSSGNPLSLQVKEF